MKSPNLGERIFKRIIYVLIACFMMPGLTMAAQTQWGYASEPLAGYWTTATDYRYNVVPVAGDEQMIYAGNPVATTCVLDVATPVLSNVRMYSGSVLDITATGALYQTGITSGVLHIGYDAGAVAEMKISGGSYTNTSTYTASPVVRLGLVSGAAGILTITGGSFTAAGIKAAYAVGSTGKINLYDGQMKLTFDSDGALYLNASGTMDIRSPGKLVMAGNRTTLLTNHMANNFIVSSDGTTLALRYNSSLNETTLQDETIGIDPDPTTEDVVFDGMVPNIATDGMGHIAIIWSADTGSVYPENLYCIYSMDGGTTFSYPALFPFYGNGAYYKNFQPNLIYDGTGKLNFAWSMATDIIAPLYTKSTNYGLSWRPKLETAALGYNVYPRDYGIALTVSPDGQIIRIFWYNCAGATDKRVYYGLSTDGGTTWATDNVTSLVGAASAGVSYVSSAVAAPNGDFYVLSKKNSKLNLARLIGGNWSSIDITGTNTSIALSNEHSIVMDTSGSLFVTWSQDNLVYFSKSVNQGSTWSNKVRVDPASTASQRKPVMGLDSYEQLVVAWQDSRSELNQIHWAESVDEGSTWSSSRAVSASLVDQNDPDMAVAGRKLHFVWMEKGSPAYSSIRRPILGDVDQNGYVDLIDFAYLANSWFVPGDVSWQMGNLNGDTIVDMMDMAILADCWLDLEIPVAGHLPLYNGDNLFPNSTFDMFVGNLPSGWTF